MKPENIYTVVGIVLAVITAIAAYYRDEDEKGHRITRAAIIALLGVILTVVMIIRWGIIPRIESNQEMARLISSEQALKTTLDLGAAALPVSKTLPVPFQEIFNEKLDCFNSYLADAALKKFLVPRTEILSTATRLIQSAQASILGTSYVKSSEWWGTPEGQRYLQIHEELLKRGVKIRRVFVFSSQKEMEDTRQLMETQEKMGITVYYAFLTDFPDYVDDLIVVDGSMCGRLILNPDKSPRSAEFYCDEKNLKRISQQFQSLVDVAKEFQ